MRNFILILNFLFFYTCTIAQTISGKVESTQDHHKTPIPFASIYWEKTSNGTLSDSNGLFTLPMDSNVHNLIINAVGFRSDTFKVIYGKPVEIILKPIFSLKDVIIVKRRASDFISSTAIQQEDIISSKSLLKAACCNLAESFETNPTVEVNFTDAVTGAKQIRLLGLAGIYSQMMIENIPDLRGLASVYGLGFIPGPWVESIQISKGSGSVVNGYESMTGQINLELTKPMSDEKLYANAYTDNHGRAELNADVAHEFNKHLSTALLTHFDGVYLKTDHNKDGFLDNPLSTNGSFSSRWNYNSGKKLMSQFGFSGLFSHHIAGQTDFNPETDKGTTNYYGAGLNLNREELYGKIGWVFPQRPMRSIGTQYQLIHEGQDAYFGLKNYSGKENSGYFNFIYQDMIFNSHHTFKTGASLLYDHYHEIFLDSLSDRLEIVPGIYGEYTYSYLNKLNIQAGLRLDDDNFNKLMLTPRLHIRTQLAPETILRLSAGKGYRTPNPWTENAGLWASSRQIIYLEKPKQEISWNYGASLLQNFTWHKRDGHLSADYYFTNFKNQYIADIDANPHEIIFYNLNGRSFAHNWQAEVGSEILNRLDVLAAYRFSLVKITELDGLLDKALQPQSRALFTTTYKTKYEKWIADFTVARYGKARLPDMVVGNEAYATTFSKPYFLINVQLTHNFKRWSVYAGSENLLNFTQPNPIIDAANPFASDFDASMIWGPLEGRRIYLGVRFKINEGDIK